MSVRRLHVSTSLSLPLDWMTLATVVYGARGSGKTTLGCVIAEEVWRAGQRFCAVDLKGDWFGLKSSVDGKSDGIPAIVFGGDHADVPLEPDAGAFIAETVATLEFPTILDLEYLSKGKQVSFLAAFFDKLYDVNRTPLLLLLDESQRYAPQRPMSPEATICLGAVEDLVKLGRKHGIGPA
jgi:ribosomal protein L25 (general stress protein Ctc)